MKTVFIIVLIVANLILTFCIRESKKKLNSLEEKEKVVTSESAFIEKRYVESSTCKLNQLHRKTYVYRTNGDSILLNDLIQNKTLVFAYNKFSCGACVSKEMQMLNEYIENHPSKNIIILGNADSFRHLISFQKVNNLKVPIYWIAENLPLFISGSDIELLYFTINKTLSLHNVFIPIKEKARLTQDYLNLVFE